MRDLYPVAHLDFGSVCPLVHQGFQFQVVVHRIIMKFFFWYLVICVLKSEVEPVKCVQKFDRLNEKSVIDDTRYNIVGQYIL